MRKELILSTEDEFMNSKPGDRYQGADSHVVLNVINDHGKTRVNVNGNSKPSDYILRGRGDNESMSLNSAWTAFHPLYTV